jgi:hypothetical protein
MEIRLFGGRSEGVGGHFSCFSAVFQTTKTPFIQYSIAQAALFFCYLFWTY